VRELALELLVVVVAESACSGGKRAAGGSARSVHGQRVAHADTALAEPHLLDLVPFGDRGPDGQGRRAVGRFVVHSAADVGNQGVRGSNAGHQAPALGAGLRNARVNVK